MQDTAIGLKSQQMFDTEWGRLDTDARLKRHMRYALGSAGAAALMLVGASWFVPVGGAVIASGRVGVESNIKRMAHPGGGTVAEILVKNGQYVRKGQIVLRLDDRVSAADAELSALSVDQLLAQRARLEAERLGAGAVRFPAALLTRSDAAAQQAMADETHMFRLRKQEAAGVAAQLQARISQYVRQIDGYRAQIVAYEKQAKLIAPERDAIRSLYEKKLVTISRLNQLERTAADFDGSIGALQAEIAQTRSRISETREQLIQLGETRRADAATRLAEVNAQLNEQQMRSVSAMDTQSRRIMRAPVSGTVEKLAVTTVGGVIRPADIVMEIVPDKADLLLEAEISPADIDQLHPGMPARIAFSALNRAATPELMGRLVYVAAERVTDPTTQRSYYPAQIAIAPQEDRNLPLKPGMPAEIFIATGERSLMSYITKPLRDQFARAFRDN